MPSRRRLLILIWTFDNDWATLKHKRIWTLCLTPPSPHQITAKTIAKLWETWHEWEESCRCFLPHPSIQSRSFSNATARLAKWICRTKGRKRHFPTSRTVVRSPISSPVVQYKSLSQSLSSGVQWTSRVILISPVEVLRRLQPGLIKRR